MHCGAGALTAPALFVGECNGQECRFPAGTDALDLAIGSVGDGSGVVTGPLLLFVVVGAFFVDFHRYSFATPPGYGSFSQAALVLVYAYVGFEGAVIPAGEMRDPGRHLPFALLTGIVVIAMLYVLIQAVCIGTLPQLADSSRPLSDASFRFLGTVGASVIAAGALVSIAGAMNALMFATPRLLFAMAENRQLPSWFLTTHSRFHTPSVAILLTVNRNQQRAMSIDLRAHKSSRRVHNTQRSCCTLDAARSRGAAGAAERRRRHSRSGRGGYDRVG